MYEKSTFKKKKKEVDCMNAGKGEKWCPREVTKVMGSRIKEENQLHLRKKQQQSILLSMCIWGSNRKGDILPNLGVASLGSWWNSHKRQNQEIICLLLDMFIWGNSTTFECRRFVVNGILRDPRSKIERKHRSGSWGVTL